MHFSQILNHTIALDGKNTQCVNVFIFIYMNINKLNYDLLEKFYQFVSDGEMLI